MRIFDFPDYIKANEMQPAELKNCSVVIDGENYFYNMCERGKCQFAYGCESDKLAAYIKQRLNMFREANVKCYFIFKGGDTDIQRKLKKLQRCNYGDKFDFNRNNKYVPRVLIREVYTQVLAEMNIPYAVCEFESKRDCVALAGQLHCPVISRDIEFCFLKAPYIHHETLRYDPERKEIQCLQYKREYFLRRYELTEQKLAIFAVLTDINIFPDNFFNDLFKSLRVFSPYSHKTYIALWKWLSQRDESNALDVINATLSQENKNKFATEMYKIMDFMQMKRPSFVANYLLNRSRIVFKPRDPNWFEKGVVNEYIPKPYIDLYTYNYLCGQSTVENPNATPSLLLSMDIIKYGYNLLTDFRRDEFKFVTGDNEINISAKRDPPTAISTPTFVNGWKEIKKMGLFNNFLKENSIDESLVTEVPSDAAILIIASVYFARKKLIDNVNVDREVYSIVTGFVILSSSGDISGKDRDEARKTMQAYFNMTSTGEKMRLLNRELLHNFVQFQQCLQHMNYLNTLCGMPYSPTIYHRTYNGTFVYKLFYEMAQGDDNCATFINAKLNSSTSVLNYINRLIDLYKKIHARAGPSVDPKPATAEKPGTYSGGPGKTKPKAKRDGPDETLSPKADPKKRKKISPQDPKPETYAAATAVPNRKVAITSAARGHISQASSDLIEERLTALLDELADGDQIDTQGPAFLGIPTYMNGALHLMCANQATEDWVKASILKIDIPNVGKLLVVHPDDMPMRVRCGLLLPLVWQGDRTRIGRHLLMSNTWAKVEKWLVHAILPQEEHNSTFIVVSVPEDLIPVIMAKGRRLSFRLGAVYLKFQNAKGRFVSTPPDAGNEEDDIDTATVNDINMDEQDAETIEADEEAISLGSEEAFLGQGNLGLDVGDDQEGVLFI